MNVNRIYNKTGLTRRRRESYIQNTYAFTPKASLFLSWCSPRSPRLRVSCFFSSDLQGLR